MLYRYVATSSDGTIKKGEIEALNEAEALESLRAMDLLPVRLEPVKRRLRLKLKRSERAQDILLFTEQLERLLKAGIPIDRALNILTRVFAATKKEFLKDLSDQLKRRLEEGQSLAQALEETNVFPEFYISLVRAGEISGALETILRDLSRYLREQRQFQQDLLSALLYPSFLLIFGLFAVQTILVFVLPRFGLIFDQMGIEPPTFTRFLLAAGQFWRTWGWLVLIFFLIAFLSMRFLIARPASRYQLENLLLKIPFLGRVLFMADMARTFRGLAVMVKGGVSIPQAVRLSSAIPTFLFFKKFLTQVTDLLKEGQKLSSLFQRFPGQFDFVANFIALGEETGNMAQAFADIAYLCEEEVQVSTKRFLTIIEPATILFFGLLLGTIIVSILMAIFDVQTGL